MPTMRDTIDAESLTGRVKVRDAAANAVLTGLAGSRVVGSSPPARLAEMAYAIADAALAARRP